MPLMKSTAVALSRLGRGWRRLIQEAHPTSRNCTTRTRCVAVEPPWARRTSASANRPSATTKTPEADVEAGEQQLVFFALRRRRVGRHVFAARLRVPTLQGARTYGLEARANGEKAGHEPCRLGSATLCGLPWHTLQPATVTGSITRTRRSVPGVVVAHNAVF